MSQELNVVISEILHNNKYFTKISHKNLNCRESKKGKKVTHNDIYLK